MVGMAIALVLIGLCVGTWAVPDLIGIDSSELSGRGGRKIVFFLNILWSRPVGTIAGIFGVLVAWGALSKKEIEV